MLLMYHDRLYLYRQSAIFWIQLQIHEEDKARVVAKYFKTGDWCMTRSVVDGGKSKNIGCPERHNS